jgi:hypothetical protein
VLELVLALAMREPAKAIGDISIVTEIAIAIITSIFFMIPA